MPVRARNPEGSSHEFSVLQTHLSKCSNLCPERRLRTELLSWMTQDKPSLLKFERRPIWQKKTDLVLHTSFPCNSERPKTEHSKWRGRLSTGETEQPAPNNGFGRSSKRLKRNCSLGGQSPAARRSQSVSSDPTYCSYQPPPAALPAAVHSRSPRRIADAGSVGRTVRPT